MIIMSNGIVPFNARERKNLEFLLSIDAETRVQWFKLASEDDKKFAMELLKRHNNNMNAHFLLNKDKVDDTMEEAKSVLKRIMK